MKHLKLAYLAFAAALVLAACQGERSANDQPRDERAVKIVAHSVAYRTEITRVEAVGTARARSSATIYPETAGEVTAVNFEAGDHVDKGDVLVQLEARAERLAVDEAEVALRDAQRTIDRYNRASTPGVIAGNEMDRAQAAYDTAKVQLDIARDALARRTIRAPFAGHVGLTDIDPGARITASTEITRLDARDTLFVDFPVPEQTFGRIGAGDIFEVEPFSDPSQTYKAEVLTVDSAIDATTRAFTVRAAIDNTNDRLRPGMSFRIGFNLPGQRYPAVPEESILWGGDGAYLWQVKDGRADRVPVTIVSRDAGMVLVKADLPEGTWIVEQGVQKVRQGTPVETPARTQTIAGPGDERREGGPSAALP